MTKFVTGQRYEYSHTGDSNLFHVYAVIERTPKTVSLYDGRTTKTRRVKCDDRGELVYPEGMFSMCPILHSSAATDKRLGVYSVEQKPLLRAKERAVLDALWS
jgi:hypothetical protein